MSAELRLVACWLTLHAIEGNPTIESNPTNESHIELFKRVSAVPQRGAV